MGILADLADMFPDTLTAQAVTSDGFGGTTASGDPLSLACYISGEAKLVRKPTGEEVTSSLQAIVAGTHNLKVTGWRYTLPSRFDPYQNLEAIGVVKVSDEDGALYEEVQFP